MDREQLPRPLSEDWARTVIASLGRDAFTRFIGEALSDYYKPHFGPASDLGPLSCFHRTLRNGGYPIGMGGVSGLYLIDHLPLHILSKPTRASLHSNDFIQTVRCVKQSRWKQSIVFILNNSVFLDDGVLQEFVLPEYDSILTTNGIELSAVGNADSIAQVPETVSFLAEFLTGYTDGLSIALNRDHLQAEFFLLQNYVASGTGAQRTGPLEQLVVQEVRRQHAVIQEFERLIASFPKERTLEAFLVEYYRDVFGFNYDQIATQIWLKLPTSDVRGRNRRLDLFLRNALSNNWELVELKLPSTPLLGNENDIPVLSRKVYQAIRQIDNYRRLLNQNEIRQTLKREGIDYVEPTMRLVIGRRPSIRNSEWNQLLGRDRSGVKIVTYDDLVGEMKSRLLPFSAFNDWRQ